MKLDLLKISICLMSFFLIGCSNNTEIDDIEPLKIEFKVFYTINGDTIIDVGSKVFVYYNVNQSDILDYFIQSDGKLIDSKDSSKNIYPSTENKVDGSGTYILVPPKGTEELLVIIWSKFYEDRKLKSIFTEYDFYRHGENQTVRLYFTEKNQGVE
ncbi:MAG: hypothetical protein A2W86_10395 [Bacteroidetes bacterium GWD2_45_23]|nr:MAG: hypothetical protein A2071_12710 [Bacteroidetes bacterium GWC1_47_7]OFX85034.1 MAG: hypothetical protein A2W86_10395 [Bacteroidetes bacterium GWD2_45_23]HBB00343.1 hypothetical protein [Porphyromonadaceae bacterium]